MKQSVKTKSIYAAAKIFNHAMSDEEQHRFGYETRTEIRAMIAKVVEGICGWSEGGR